MSIIFNICAVIIVLLGFYIGCSILSDDSTKPKYKVIKTKWYGDISVPNCDDEEDEYEINPVRGDSDNEYSDDSETSDTEDEE